MSFDLKGTHTRILRRGDIRLLLLDMLRVKPLHGYELAKKISGLSHGLYEPSPGVVYPTLQWLEDEGYVSISVKGKKTYTITKKGISFLEVERVGLERMKKVIEAMAEGERAEVVKSGRKLARALIMLFGDMDDQKAREARGILDDARAKIAALVFE